jgi:hypothetical protein
MSPIETVLVFAGIPLVVIALVTFAVYGRSALHQPNRYRPGRSWTYPAVWYVAHPEAIEDVVPERIPIEGASGRTVAAVGGASGEW